LPRCGLKKKNKEKQVKTYNKKIIEIKTHY